jgi:alpha-1,3-rhamnosyltransferase
MSPPFVSIILPVFNPTTDIIEVAKSINSQTYSEIEVVVVDDHSTEGVELLRTLTFERFASKFLTLPQNSGSCAKPLNVGFAASSGTLISIAAQDDLFYPQKIESQVEFMLKNTSYGMCFTDSQIVLVDSPKQRISRTPKRRGGMIFEDLILQRFYIPSTSVLLRREALMTVGGYDESLYLEDWDMHLRVSKLYPVGYIATPLSITRVVANSMSQRVSSRHMSESRLAVLAKWAGLPLHKTAVEIVRYLDYRVWGGTWSGLFFGVFIAMFAVRQPYRLLRVFVGHILHKTRIRV